MLHTVKAVDVTPTVGCNDLITTTTKLDACHKRRPVPPTPLSGEILTQLLPATEPSNSMIG